MCIQLEDVIIHALHVVLRAIPEIYRATAIPHVDQAECQCISQWLVKTHRDIVSSNTVVLNASGREATVGTECWHRKVCEKHIQIYSEILEHVHFHVIGKHEILSQCFGCFPRVKQGARKGM